MRPWPALGSSASNRPNDRGDARAERLHRPGRTPPAGGPRSFRWGCRRRGRPCLPGGGGGGGVSRRGRHRLRRPSGVRRRLPARGSEWRESDGGRSPNEIPGLLTVAARATSRAVGNDRGGRSADASGERARPRSYRSTLGSTGPTRFKSRNCVPCSMRGPGSSKGSGTSGARRASGSGSRDLPTRDLSRGFCVEVGCAPGVPWQPRREHERAI